MRKASIAAVAALFTLMLGTQTALAASPHFVKGPSYTATTTELTATGKAAGMANVTTSAFMTATTVNTFFHCVNKGGNFAPGHPASESPVTGPTEDISPRNGQITFSVSLPAVVPDADTECPNGNWRVIVDEVDYIGVVLHFQQGGVDILTDGPNDFTTCDAGFGECVFTG